MTTTPRPRRGTPSVTNNVTINDPGKKGAAALGRALGIKDIPAQASREEPANSHGVFLRLMPPGAAKAKVKAYGPIDRSTANATLAKEKRAYQKAYGTLEGFIGHALVLFPAPAEA